VKERKAMALKRKAMALKKTLRASAAGPEMPAGRPPDRAAAEGTAVASAPAPPLPRTTSVDTCATRATRSVSTLNAETAGFAEPRYVTMRWSDVEELHFMLNAVEKERKRLEEKLALMSDILEENSMLRATLELLERERRSG
jgi:hypothetical protein